ncbi:MAG: hypothetical protein H7Y32_18995 [Chloroflexales bacterium]|nr:hypothetical protein [Chloroflexales bacterium]
MYILVWALLALAGCSYPVDTPAAPPTATMGAAPSFEPLTALLSAAQPQHTVVTAGYYYLGRDGASLVDGLSFSADAPQPLSDAPEQLWLGQTPAPPEAASKGYAPVLAQGLLEGPGRYGPEGRFLYQLVGGSLTPLTPIELTLQALLAKAFVYDGQLVRVRGALLVSSQSSLLVERLNKGGIPPAEARQVKLLPPFRDEALRARLPGASGVVRYGSVEVEGFWRGGALLPLGITLR